MILSLEIEVTGNCNLTCDYCGAYSRVTHEKKELTTQQWAMVLNECRKLKIPYLTITGGEPLLREDIFEILSEINWTKFVLNSNGTLINEICAKKLEKNKNLRAVGVSLDGANSEVNDLTRGKGNFYAAVRGIKNLLNHGIITGISTTVQKFNAPFLEKLVEFTINLGVNQIAFNYPVYVGWGKNAKSFVWSSEEITETAKRIKELTIKYPQFISAKEWVNRANLDKHLKIKSENREEKDFVFKTCDLGKRSAYIRCNGNVLPCAFIGDEWNFGNILDNTLSDIWSISDKRKTLINMLSGEKKIGNQCCNKKCEYAGICPPGCLASTCDEKGSFECRDLLWCIKNN